ncbi:hypothetical protein H3146_00065 [Streptomyces sp. OF3]|uniref:Uncharacterized protein n=2 Tax=Streptomyces alkaliterrae TaxID=2213162 RepID=A0A7W3WG95_9ACTN|nr:hypothetical protein [Streptomyces alkaliterrae]
MRTVPQGHLREAPPMLTITVYRVRADGTRTPVLSTRTVTGDEEPDWLTLPGSFPPCECPRCRPAAQKP